MRIETLMMVKGVIRKCQENFKSNTYTRLNDICSCFLDIEEDLEGLIENIVFCGENPEQAKQNRLDRISYKLSIYFNQESEEQLDEKELLLAIKENVIHVYKNIEEYNKQSLLCEIA